jgi:uncharacterized protein YndB with AHSA1/START domain
MNTRKLLSHTITIAGAACLIGAGAAVAQTAAESTPPGDVGPSTKTMETDVAHRSMEIHWPQGFDPTHGDLFAHNALQINTSCEVVWDRIVDADKWPTWYPNSKAVKILGGAKKLGKDVRFRWSTFGHDIESKVNEFEPYTRIGWYGYVPGKAPAAYHTWFLTPRNNGCFVVMDETGVGPYAAGRRAAAESYMHRGHDLWLATLKWASEGK